MTNKFKDSKGRYLKGEALADAIKRRGVEAFNKARADDPDWVPDLSSADLSGANLIDADLRRADLSGANLTDANLSRADLRGAKLSGADLSRALLIRANLYNADLREAKLSGAVLNNANLREAKLRRADLGGADLYNADLTCADLREADLSRALLIRANLEHADLREAKLSGANLSNADLSEANLRYADLSEADLSGADLNYTDLSGVKELLDPVAWITQHCETRDDGWIVAYKAVGETIYASPWGEPQPDLEITEECNPCRTVDCGCGVNVATLEWVTANYPNHEIWEILVHPLGAVIPYATDGKFRASRARWSKRVQVCMRGETND